MILKSPAECIGVVPYHCDYCCNMGFKPKKKANAAIKNGHGLFCGSVCVYNHRSARAKVTHTCVCGQRYTQTLSEATQFCSKSCASKSRVHSEDTKLKIAKSLLGTKHYREKKITYCIICHSEMTHSRKTCSPVCEQTARRNNGIKSARISVKRSKDEIKLYELVRVSCPNAQHNVPVVKCWDADIVMEHEKIAILWNGIWHREQLSFSNHSLSQVQNRDRLKIKEFEEAGWTVLVYEDNEWTPETAYQDILKRGTPAETRTLFIPL